MLLPLHAAAPAGKGVNSTLASSVGVTVTAGATNVMGSWVTLLDPLPDAVFGLHVFITNPNTSRHVLFDIGIAPTGTTTYTVVANYIPADASPRAGDFSHVYLPVYLPKGVRAGIRNQSPTSGATMIASAQFQAGGGPMELAFQKMATMGATPATTRGTTLDAGATPNTKPATWTTLSAATTVSIRALMLMPTWFITSTSTRSFNVDIGVGAASSEVAVVNNLVFEFHASRDLPAPLFYGPIPAYIPEGARVSARTAASTATAADRVIDVIAYGLT
jgi:hypothetical protein